MQILESRGLYNVLLFICICHWSKPTRSAICIARIEREEEILIRNNRRFIIDKWLFAVTCIYIYNFLMIYICQSMAVITNRDVVAFNYIRLFITIAYYKFIYSLFDDIVIFPFITQRNRNAQYR